MGFALSPMQLTSTSFTAKGPIPGKYAYATGNTSPALSWSDAPEGTKSFAVICHDPDAPLISPGTYGFVHWVLYNLPASTSSLDENTTQGTAGNNDFGEKSWGGPMPPVGHGEHHYFFWLLALDTDETLPEGLTLWEFLAKVEPHVIGANRLMGTYQR